MYFCDSDMGIGSSVVSITCIGSSGILVITSSISRMTNWRSVPYVYVLSTYHSSSSQVFVNYPVEAPSVKYIYVCPFILSILPLRIDDLILLLLVLPWYGFFFCFLYLFFLAWLFLPPVTLSEGFSSSNLTPFLSYFCSL